MSYLPSILENGLEPDEIDEVSESLTYIGYFERGNKSLSMIKKIQKTDTVTSFTFPNGNRNFLFNWDNRAAFDYLPKVN